MAHNVNKIHKESLSWDEKIMIGITGIVGSSLFVLFCILLSFTPFVFPSTLNLVQFISSGFLQLILLPIVLISGNLQSRHSELRAEADYQTNLKAELEIQRLHDKLDALMGKKVE